MTKVFDWMIQKLYTSLLLHVTWAVVCSVEFFFFFIFSLRISDINVSNILADVDSRDFFDCTENRIHGERLEANQEKKTWKTKQTVEKQSRGNNFKSAPSFSTPTILFCVQTTLYQLISVDLFIFGTARLVWFSAWNFMNVW